MGLIYRAYQPFNGKSYIGQTINGLQTRLNQHRLNSKYDKVKGYKFYRAINKYGFETFVWTILEEVDNYMLDERETYWINHYDSCINGYNSTNGGKQYKGGKGSDIHSLWHPQYGLIRGTLRNLMNCIEMLQGDRPSKNFISTLKGHNNKPSRQYKGWVLYENKDDYDNLKYYTSTKYKLYNRYKGVVEGTIPQLIDMIGLSIGRMLSLIRGTTSIFEGWVLYDNRMYYDLLLKNGLLPYRNTISGEIIYIPKEQIAHILNLTNERVRQLAEKNKIVEKKVKVKELKTKKVKVKKVKKVEIIEKSEKIVNKSGGKTTKMYQKVIKMFTEY